MSSDFVDWQDSSFSGSPFTTPLRTEKRESSSGGTPSQPALARSSSASSGFQPGSFGLHGEQQGSANASLLDLSNEQFVPLEAVYSQLDSSVSALSIQGSSLSNRDDMSSGRSSFGLGYTSLLEHSEPQREIPGRKASGDGGDGEGDKQAHSGTLTPGTFFRQRSEQLGALDSKSVATPLRPNFRTFAEHSHRKENRSPNHDNSDSRSYSSSNSTQAAPPPSNNASGRLSEHAPGSDVYASIRTPRANPFALKQPLYVSSPVASDGSQLSDMETDGSRAGGADNSPEKGRNPASAPKGRLVPVFDTGKQSPSGTPAAAPERSPSLKLSGKDRLQTLVAPNHGTASVRLLVKNGGGSTFQLECSIAASRHSHSDGSWAWFSVHPRSLTLQPSQSCALVVRFSPKLDASLPAPAFVEGELRFVLLKREEESTSKPREYTATPCPLRGRVLPAPSQSNQPDSPSVHSMAETVLAPRDDDIVAVQFPSPDAQMAISVLNPFPQSQCAWELQPFSALFFMPAASALVARNGTTDPAPPELNASVLSDVEMPRRRTITRLSGGADVFRLAARRTATTSGITLHSAETLLVDCAVDRAALSACMQASKPPLLSGWMYQGWLLCLRPVSDAKPVSVFVNLYLHVNM